MVYRFLTGRDSVRRKKTAAFIAASALLFSLCTPSFSDAAVTAYSDVRGTECEEAVAALTEKAVINGYEDGTFRPDNQITRAEVSKIFAALLEQEDLKVALPEDADVSDTILYSVKAEKSEEDESENMSDAPADGNVLESETSKSAASGITGTTNAPSDEASKSDEEKADNAALSEQLSKDLKDDERMQEIALVLYDDLGEPERFPACAHHMWQSRLSAVS